MYRHSFRTALGLLCVSALVSAEAVAQSLPRLKVRENHRFLVKEDGTPFFWLGDTVWELFQRPNREEVNLYLETRAAQQFTVVQAVVLGEICGASAAKPALSTLLLAAVAEGRLPSVDAPVKDCGWALSAKDEAKLGTFEPGKEDGVANQNLKLLVDASGTSADAVE